jgi:hypothetical protein
MPSSTSSSERRRRGGLRPCATGIGTFAVLAAAATTLAPAPAREADIVSHRTPPRDGSYYLAYDRGGQVDHHVLYHGIDRVALERMRAARVLFLGNSRLMFALDRGSMRSLFDATGQTYYVLGFGHTEQDDFPGRIIARYDLRPDVVVVNADGFFSDSQSDWATKTVRESRFDAWKLQFESEATHAARRLVHRFVPQYVDLWRGGREVIIYRSRLDGTWFIANQFDEGTPFPWPTPLRESPSEQSLRAAEAFKRDIEARGARLVLCLVPSPQASLHRAQLMAAHLQVPLVSPPVDGLTSIDGSHLSAASSFRFEQAFLPALREHLRR